MKTLIGIVTGTKMKNTAVVQVVRTATHPLYKKIVKRKKKFICQDDLGVENGQRVKIIETRPYSKTKSWKILEKLT